MAENKKRTKKQNLLNEEQTNEMLKLISKRSDLKIAKNRLGVTSATICGWRKKKAFPFYCGLFLEFQKLKNLLN